ncbi:MAG: trypsin-like peptidase domain-containing protein [Ilumatobacteraceae bacterium]
MTALRASVVEVWLRGQLSGSGFVASPTSILTTSHVLDSEEALTPADIVIRCNGAEVYCETYARTDPGEDGSDSYALPDIAIIRVVGELSGPLTLSARGPTAMTGSFHVAGITADAEYVETHGHAISVRGELLELQSDIAVEPGMSGGPLIDDNTGEVIGIIKSVWWDDGSNTVRARAVPASAIRRYLRGLATIAADVTGRVQDRLLPPASVDMLETVPRPALVHDLIEFAKSRAPGMLAVIGPPGFGKSTIAAMARSDLAAKGFAVGWFEEDAELSPEENLHNMVALATGRPPTLGAGGHHLLDGLRSAIEGLDAVVVDNHSQLEASSTIRTISRFVPVIVTSIHRDLYVDTPIVEVVALSRDQVIGALSVELPDDPHVWQIADAVAGWPLLMRIVISAIRRMKRWGESDSEISHRMLEALQAGQTTSFDSAQAQRSRSIKATLSLALRDVGETDRQRALDLGFLRGQSEMPISLLQDLWSESNHSAVETLGVLADLSLIDLNLTRRTVRVHMSVADGLAALVEDQTRRRAILQTLADHLWALENSDDALVRHYRGQHLVWYLGKVGDMDRALNVITSPDWWESAIESSGGAGALGRQVRQLDGVPKSTGQAILLELAARIVSTLTEPDRVPVFQLIADTPDEDIEDFVANIKDRESRIEAANAFSRMLFRRGEKERSARLALEAVTSAAAYFELELPDAMGSALRSALRVHPALERAASERVDKWMQQLDPSTQLRFRAVLGEELLSIAPTMAAALIAPVAGRIKRELLAQNNISYTYSDASRLLELILPVLALTEPDIAELAAEVWLETRDRDFVVQISMLATDGALAVSGLEDQQLSDLALVLHALGRSDEGLLVADKIRLVGVRCKVIASIAARLGDADLMAKALGSCEQAMSVHAKVSAFVDVVQSVADFDLSWATKISRQLLVKVPARNDFTPELYRLMMPLLEILATSDPADPAVSEFRALMDDRTDDSLATKCRLQILEPLAALSGAAIASALRGRIVTPYEAIQMAIHVRSNLAPIYDELAIHDLIEALDLVELVDFLEATEGSISREAGFSYFWQQVTLKLALQDIAEARRLIKTMERIDVPGAAECTRIVLGVEALTVEPEFEIDFAATQSTSESELPGVEVIVGALRSRTPGALDHAFARFFLEPRKLDARRTVTRAPFRVPLSLRKTLIEGLLTDHESLDWEQSGAEILSAVFYEVTTMWNRSLADLCLLHQILALPQRDLEAVISRELGWAGSTMSIDDLFQWLIKSVPQDPTLWLQVFAFCVESRPSEVEVHVLATRAQQSFEHLVASVADRDWDEMWHIEEIPVDSAYACHVFGMGAAPNGDFHSTIRLLLPGGVADFAVAVALRHVSNDDEWAQYRARALESLRGLSHELNSERVAGSFGRLIELEASLGGTSAAVLDGLRAAPGSFAPAAYLLLACCSQWVEESWAVLLEHLPRLCDVAQRCSGTD